MQQGRFCQQENFLTEETQGAVPLFLSGHAVFALDILWLLQED